jgi:hypothetical protein
MIRQFAKTIPNFRRFKNRKPHNTKTGMTADERIIQNAIVCGRRDYGRPLREQGFEVRKSHTKEGYSFGLFRCPKAPKVPAKAAKRKKANQKKSGKVKAVKTLKAKARGRQAQD